MSTQPLTGVAAGDATGELALAQRVQQLRALIESARVLAAGGMTAATSSSPGLESTAGGGYSSPAAANTDFASALQAATTADVSSAAGAPSAGLTQPGVEAAAASGDAGGEYDSLIDQAASRNGLDPAVLHGLIQQESGFDPNATSSAGASGLTQLMPGTASSLGVADPLNPAESIEGGARYLGQLMSQFGGNTEDALAAYNAGPGAVQQYGGIPPYAETQGYVSKVLGYADAYRQSNPASATGVLA